MKKFIIKFFQKLGLFFKNRDIISETSNPNAISILLVNVEASPIWGSCVGSSKDCETFMELAKNAIGENVNISWLKNERATAKNFKQTLEEIIEKPLAIIFYSGHGGSDKTHTFGKGIDEEDGIDEFLCLYDKPVLDDEIWNIISKSKGRVFLIFDCCHSGTMFRSVVGEESISSEEKQLSFDFNQFIMTDKDGCSENIPNITCWSACADDTVAKGSIFGGVFTNSLKSLYENNDTYQNLWNKLSNDKNLNRIEKIQIHEIGKSFKDELFCR